MQFHKLRIHIFFRGMFAYLHTLLSVLLTLSYLVFKIYSSDYILSFLDRMVPYCFFLSSRSPC